MQDMLARLEEKRGALKKKGGFTLVELIVVLVILAILAAILVPTLLGYINQANTEKDYATAQTVRVAAQAVATDNYARDKANNKSQTIALDSKTKSGQTVSGLAGVDESHVKSCEFTATDGKITGTGTVVIDNSTYTYDSSANSWSAAATS
jgi:prepilin-type N-terminal cleavage/methylation domain-containing protein